MTAAVHATHKAWIDEADLSLDDFRAQVLRATDPADYPLASDVRSNVLVYSAATVAAADRRALQSELIRALADGPGVVVFEGAFDADVVDRASEAFFAIIDAQRAAGSPPVTTSASPAPTTGSGTPRRSSPCTAPAGIRRLLRQRRACDRGVRLSHHLDCDQPIDQPAPPTGRHRPARVGRDLTAGTTSMSHCGPRRSENAMTTTATRPAIALIRTSRRCGIAGVDGLARCDERPDEERRGPVPSGSRA